ncbi:MAG TPA: DNA-3-methyladenine glycosylase [Acidimicrobiales bacterium]|nr:DNA-3-methyladenine glycosylase [Acidimicrobiales bacterium]
MEPVERSFLAGPAPEVAPRLLNKILLAADGRAGRIVEVEAYGGPPDQDLPDPAAHSFRGPKGRNLTMFGPPGHLYVYFSYGVHWCANVVTSRPGQASAVLLRALAPVSGVDAMRRARWRNQKRQDDLDLCRGPGRLAQAMGIDRTYDGVDLCAEDSPVRLVTDGTNPPDAPMVTTRIGISVGVDTPWRFAVPGHPGVSGGRRVNFQ